MRTSIFSAFLLLSISAYAETSDMETVLSSKSIVSYMGNRDVAVEPVLLALLDDSASEVNKAFALGIVHGAFFSAYISQQRSAQMVGVDAATIASKERQQGTTGFASQIGFHSEKCQEFISLNAIDLIERMRTEAYPQLASMPAALWINSELASKCAIPKMTQCVPK